MRNRTVSDVLRIRQKQGMFAVLPMVLRIFICVLVFSSTGIGQNALKEYIYLGDRLIAVETTGSSSGPPSNLIATASTASQVQLSWSAPVASPDHYGVWRSSGGTWSRIGTSGTTNYSDTTVSPTTAYFYVVSAEDVSNLAPSWSNLDLATTVIFTDDPLVAGSTVVKAVHVTELRIAVNAVRAAAGLSAANWTN